MSTTLAKLRTKRARELQTQLQALTQFQRSSRSHVAAIAREWKAHAKRLERALAQMNTVLPDELQFSYLITPPGEVLDSLTAALTDTWQLTELLPELRKLGPKLAKIEPAKVRNKRAKLAVDRAKIEKDAHIYQQMRDDLADPERFANRLHNANISQKLDGKPPYNETSYRKQLNTYIAEYMAKRRAAGL